MKSKYFKKLKKKLIMKLFLMLSLVLSFYFTTCTSTRLDSNNSPSPKNEKSQDTTGKATFKDLATAHQKYLATENKYDVNFIKSWVDEKKGKVYCLSAAKDAQSILRTHAEAHRLLPSSIFKVTMSSEGNMIDGIPLFIDIHNDFRENANVDFIEKSYSENTTVQKEYGVNFLNYWSDRKTGTIFCLSQAPDSNAIIFAHREAHILTPRTILEVK
jgi:hypothetical protein